MFFNAFKQLTLPILKKCSLKLLGYAFNTSTCSLQLCLSFHFLLTEPQVLSQIRLMPSFFFWVCITSYTCSLLDSQEYAGTFQSPLQARLFFFFFLVSICLASTVITASSSFYGKQAKDTDVCTEWVESGQIKTKLLRTQSFSVRSGQIVTIL